MLDSTRTDGDGGTTDPDGAGREAPEVPRVVAPPPVIYTPPLAIGLALESLWPTAVVPDSLQYWLGFALVAAAGLLMPFVLLEFRRAGTSFDTGKPTEALITTGPFRLSRNPSYLALTSFCLGLTLAADSLWMLLLLIVAAAVVHYGVVLPEERYLEHRFGDEYRAYKDRVRRWL